MFPKLKDFLLLLEEIAPVGLAEEWDNPGLQLGALSQEIGKILVALDPTIQTLVEAGRREAQLLLTHHPLIFNPLVRIETGSYPGYVIAESQRLGISIVSAHTNLDAAKGGINDILASLLALENVEVLHWAGGSDITKGEGVVEGLGRIGDLPKAMSLGELAQEVKAVLKLKRLRVVGDQENLVRKVGVVAGAGGSLVSQAGEKGAQVLLTGDVSHHQALEASRRGLALIDGGHFSTEKIPLERFAKHLENLMTARGWTVAVEVALEESNPVAIV